MRDGCNSRIRPLSTQVLELMNTEGNQSQSTLIGLQQLSSRFASDLANGG